MGQIASWLKTPCMARYHRKDPKVQTRLKVSAVQIPRH
jgi:hypothetical protein